MKHQKKAKAVQKRGLKTKPIRKARLDDVSPMTILPNIFSEEDINSSGGNIEGNNAA